MMKNLFLSIVFLLALTAAAIAQAPQAPQTKLKVGDVAPDFTLSDTEGNKVKLSDYRGKKNVVLAFYVLAFTGG
jgi:cytochrome oxidase Cu insertion factor (SCO1/SenC/PrrC family)